MAEFRVLCSPQYIEQQGNWLASCIWDAVILQVRILSTLRSYRNIRCSPQYKRVGDVTFKTYKVWNEWQLHTGELIAYTLIWALQCNQVSTRHLQCFRGVQISQGPLCFHVFIMLSFCLNPLLGSQRLKKLPYQCSLVQWFRIVPLQGKGHQFNSNRSNTLWVISFNWSEQGTVNPKVIGSSPIQPARTFARSLVKQLAILDATISESFPSAIRRSNQ